MVTFIKGKVKCRVTGASYGIGFALATYTFRGRREDRFNDISQELVTTRAGCI